MGQVVTDQVTLQSLLDSCLANVAKAAHEECDKRALLARLPAGDPRVVGTQKEPPLAYQITAAAHEQQHWREYAEYYRGRIAREGRDGKATIQMLRQHRQPTQPTLPEPDRRLPREPGDDQEEETGELPF